MGGHGIGTADWQRGKTCPSARGPHGAALRPSVRQTSKRVGTVLHASLQSVLHKEESLGPERQKVGFLG